MIHNFDAIGFCQHIYQYGLELEPSKIKYDGKWHNCRMIDNAPGKKAGCYAIYLNTGIAIFKTWRDNEVHKFYPNTINRTSNIDIKKLMKEQQQKRYELWYQVSKASFAKYCSIVNSNIESAYLIRKNIHLDKSILDVKVDKQGNLVIPYYNSKGYIATLQTIWPNGTKIFEEGGNTSGCFHKIGFNAIKPNYQGEIYLGEGFATMVSVYKAVNKPCVSCGFACNILPVFDNLIRLYPNAKIIVCADNDICLREMPLGSGHMIWDNPGVIAAVSCQLQHQCDVVIPDFESLNSNEELTDFNDLEISFGIDEVRKQIIAQLNHKSENPYVKEAWNIEDYGDTAFNSKLISFKNYFENFGQADIDDDADKSVLLTVKNLQLDYKNYEETNVTNLFVNFSLALTEQITNEVVTIKYHPNQFTTFEKTLEEVKLTQLIELDQKLNKCYSEIKNLQQENTTLKCNLGILRECEHG